MAYSKLLHSHASHVCREYVSTICLISVFLFKQAMCMYIYITEQS